MKKEASKKTLNPGSHSEMRFNAKCEKCILLRYSLVKTKTERGLKFYSFMKKPGMIERPVTAAMYENARLNP